MAIFFVALLVSALAVLFCRDQKPAVPDAAALFPKESIFYWGTQSPVAIDAGRLALLEESLQADAGLTAEESRIISDWVGDLQGVHVGFRGFTLVPFNLDAAVVLEGPSDRPLADLLGEALRKRILPADSYRDVKTRMLHIPLGKAFSVEIYITDPVDDRVIVAFSRQMLTDLIDRMLSGGPSLAGNPDFIKMASLKEIRSADTLRYLDLKKYHDFLLSWVQMIPSPQVKSFVNFLSGEFRLADYGQSGGGWNFEKEKSCLFTTINPENLLYKQLSSTDLDEFPRVPQGSSQFAFVRVADPSEAAEQLVELAIRLEKELSRSMGENFTHKLSHLIERVSAVADSHPAELGSMLSGEMGFWQRPSFAAPKTSAVCCYFKIIDAESVRKKIESIPGIEICERDDFYVPESGGPWVLSVQSDALLISNHRDYLKESLDSETPTLTESEEFAELLARLPKNFSMLQYVNYSDGIPVRNAGSLPPAFLSLLELFRGFRQVSVSFAEDGLFQSHTAWRFSEGGRLLQTFSKALFSAAWEYPKPEDSKAFALSAEEAYEQSVELLSAGRQSEAEELIDRAVRTYSSNAEILFAKAVLRRSRWSKRESYSYFSRVVECSPQSDRAQASTLCLALDQNPSEEKLMELARLSDANPDDVYMLWLSAFQCRQQKNGPLGRERYEKLLAKFEVGPVLLHQTYANILEEYLEDYETALKHRYLAVSLEAKGWSLEGLANTLTRVERYQEACAVWARAVRVDPRNSNLWGNWGWTLRRMNRYEEALEKHREAFRLDPSSAYDVYNVGSCLRKLERNQEAVVQYRRAAALGSTDALFELGRAFVDGAGVEQDFTKAVEWYRRAAKKKHVMALSNLGVLIGDGKGVEQDYNEQLACYKKALTLNPDHANSLNSYAWMLATCQDVSFRDYSKAVEFAERSVELDEQFCSLDTLAVAYDRNGQIEKAVETQKRLIAFRQKRNPERPVPGWLQKRLEKFEKKLAEQSSASRLQTN